MKLLFTTLLLILSMAAFAAPLPQSVSGFSATTPTSDIVLSWSASSTDIYGNAATITSYNVYRSTDPNFVPDYAGGINRVAQPASAGFTDSGAASSTESYYYRVTAVTDTGGESLVPSALAGKTRLDLVYNAGGSNRHWIALPQSTTLATASDLGNTTAGISKVIRFDPASQAEQVWDAVAGTGTNFALTPGEGIAIEIDASTTLNIVGVYNASPITLNHNTTDFNRQWLSIPFPSVYGTASDIAQALPSATKVTSFDTAGDSYKSWFKLDGSFIGDNFPVEPGVSIQVSVTSAGSFTPDTREPEAAPLAVPDTGYESITVDLTANATDSDGSIASIQWDLNNDGVFDTTGSTAQFSYLVTGASYPTVLVTDNDGHRALAYATVMVDSLGVTFSVDGFDPGAGQLANIQYTLPLDGTVSLRIYDQNDTLIKTLLNNQLQTAGLHSIDWDGSKDAGGIVGDGAFYVVIDYTTGGFTSTYDTRISSGGFNNTQGITGLSVSNTLSPLQGDYVQIDYNLAENSTVTLEIRDSNGDLVKTLLSNDVQITGVNRIVWDGTNNSGLYVASGTSFTVNISSTSLASNSIVATGAAPVIANVSAAPLRFSPATNPYGVTLNSSVLIDFNLSKSANVTLTVFDASGAQLGNAIDYPGLSSGANQVSWNGFKSSGTLAASGIYTVQMQAESGGQLSTVFNVQTEIFY